MYILIKISTNGVRGFEKVSKRKYKLESFLKERGYYFGKGVGMYIDDKTSGIDGGSGIDYLIQKIDVID